MKHHLNNHHSCVVDDNAIHGLKPRGKTNFVRFAHVVGLLHIVLLAAPSLYAHDISLPGHAWIYRNRVIMTGSSDHSDPDGYMVFSALTLEAGISRQFSRVLAAELTIRTESHEVDFTDSLGVNNRLGSIEFLPINLLLQFYLPMKGAVHPYLGVGGNATICWEKSGTLDTLPLSNSIGPALQAGVDFDIGAYALFNIDIKWNMMRTDIQTGGTTIATLMVDPITFGIGLGFRF